LRRAYDYWQNQPGCCPREPLRVTELHPRPTDRPSTRPRSGCEARHSPYTRRSDGSPTLCFRDTPTPTIPARQTQPITSCSIDESPLHEKEASRVFQPRIPEAGRYSPRGPCGPHGYSRPYLVFQMPIRTYPGTHEPDRVTRCLRSHITHLLRATLPAR